MKSMRKYLSLALFSLLAASYQAYATNAPTNLAATGTSSSQVSLTWTDNSSDETGFTFAFDTNSAFTNATYVYAGGANTTSYNHTGRSTATTYFYKIKAEGNPDSTWTAVDSATTSPASLAASPVSSSQINVSWSGNSGNTNIIGYTVASNTSNSFSGASYQYVSGAGSTSLSKTGLYAGTTYYFWVKAEGSSDAYDSPFTSSVSAATTSAAPNAPSGLTATVLSSSRIDLAWTDNSSNETGFEVKRATDSGFTQNVVWIGGIQGSSYSNTGLSPSTTYYYKVRAEGTTQDSAYSSSVSATTNSSGDTIPTAPSGLGATAISGSRIDLSWTDNSSNETGFELKRATDSGFTQNVVWIGGIQGTSYSNTGLTASTTYYYKVRAQGTAGSSAYSSSVNATTSGSSFSGGTPISPHFYGVNAWMPYQIGSHKYYGKLDIKWAEVQASGAQIMRYGGNGPDHWADPSWVDPSDSTKSTLNQYLALVDEMRSRGIEPVLQVPVYGGAYSASQAADIVEFINVTNSRAVKYWIIGNEPDLSSSPYVHPTTASTIAAYFKPFASAMKAVDPSIKIIGPEITWYNDTIINGLTSCDGGSDDITGTDGSGHAYVDILSFHTYNGFNGTQTRSQVLTSLTQSGGFNDDLTTLKGRLNTCNSYHSRSGSNALLMAITEANVNYQNSSTDSLTGVGATSFVGGQWWAEFLGIAMRQGVDFVTFWSTIEGDVLANELGYLGADGTKRPSYYHFQMMAQNFRGNAVAVTDTQTNVKAFAAGDVDQIAVLIMNQEQSTNYNYTVRLNTGTVSGSNPLKVSVDAGLAVESTGTIASESTLVLIFDSAGTLKKKLEYKLYGNANSGLPPTVTTY